MLGVHTLVNDDCDKTRDWRSMSARPVVPVTTINIFETKIVWCPAQQYMRGLGEKIPYPPV